MNTSILGKIFQRFDRSQWVVLLFTLVYTVGFSIFFLRSLNIEFLLYAGVIIFFIALITVTVHKSGFPLWLLWLLSLWGLVHLAGGAIPVGSGVLYGWRVLPLIDAGGDFFILKFDQLVHAYGFGVATLVLYYLLLPQLKDRVRWGVLYFVLIAGGIGLGAINEILEFLVTLTAPETGIGGYVNTSLDLVSNAIGATVAVLLIHLRIRNLDSDTS